MTHTTAEQNFRDTMNALVKREYDELGRVSTLKVKPGLDYALNANVEPYRWGGAARTLILETAYNLIDAGLNGDAVNTWEFRHAIEHDGPEEHAEAVSDNDTGAELAGQIYRNDWAPGYSEHASLGGYVDYFTTDIADEIAGILCGIAIEIEETCQGEAENDENDAPVCETCGTPLTDDERVTSLANTGILTCENDEQEN